MKMQKNVDEKNLGIFQSEMALWIGIITTAPSRGHPNPPSLMVADFGFA